MEIRKLLTKSASINPVRRALEIFHKHDVSEGERVCIYQFNTKVSALVQYMGKSSSDVQP